MVGQSHDQQSKAVALQDDRAPSLFHIGSSSHCLHPGRGEEANGVEERNPPVIESVVVGESHAVHAEMAKHVYRNRRGPKEERLHRVGPSFSPVRYATLQIQHEQVDATQRVGHLVGKQRLGRLP